MDGEFRVRLRKYDSQKIIHAFNEYYVSNLGQVYAKSAYNANSMVNLADFCAGYQTNDSLFLVYNREGNYLKVYVEPANKKDLNHMKELLNRYFKGVTEMLDNKNIKWSKPQATITLEESPLMGHFKTKKETLWQIFEDQREKMFLAPLGMVAATAVTTYFHIAGKNEPGNDVGKAVTLALEALFIFVGLIIVKVLITPNKRVFAFKI